MAALHMYIRIDGMDKNTKSRIKEIRSISGLSQVRFSAKYGIPRRTIESWEMGERQCPTYVIELLERVVNEDFPKA